MGQNPKSWMKNYQKDKWKPCEPSGHNHRSDQIGQYPKSWRKKLVVFLLENTKKTNGNPVILQGTITEQDILGKNQKVMRKFERGVFGSLLTGN